MTHKGLADPSFLSCKAGTGRDRAMKTAQIENVGERKFSDIYCTKAFRSQLRGVGDIRCFIFILATLYAWLPSVSYPETSAAPKQIWWKI